MLLKNIGYISAISTALLMAFGSPIKADERLFAFSHQADSILPKGSIEIEQWVTARSGKDTGRYTGWDLRHEIEYGFTDTLTGAIYINTGAVYADGVSTGVGNRFGFDGISLELKQMLASPYRNPVGMLVYFEPTFSGSELELEGKLVFEHIQNKTTHYVLNIVTEQEWEYTSTSTEHNSAVVLSGGIAQKLDPNLSIGLEAKSVSRFSGFYGNAQSTAIFLGPNARYGIDKIQIVGGIMKQLTDIYTTAEAWEARMIVGIFL